MNDQERVAAFIEQHDIEAPPAYRLLDLVSEVGELGKEATTSTAYGNQPDTIAISEDEIGDALFALLALAESVDTDASEALNSALEKYEQRLGETGDPGSRA